MEHTEEEMETPAPETPAEEKDPITLLEESLAAETDRALRIAAEYDNYRKRSQKEREMLMIDVTARIVTEFLPVHDNLERALKQPTDDVAYVTGIQMTMAGLEDVLAKIGVTKIAALGEVFNPELHNAVSHIEDDAHGEQEIVEEFLAGFLFGQRVIRHSMVKVAN